MSDRNGQSPTGRTNRTAFCAFFLAAISCVLGLAFCLVKSPQAKAAGFMALAVTAMEEGRHDHAAAAALEAVRLDPLRAEGWQILSAVLQSHGDERGAAQARAIAFRVQHKSGDAPPVYAMPAEFRLSLLASAETGNP